MSVKNGDNVFVCGVEEDDGSSTLIGVVQSEATARDAISDYTNGWYVPMNFGSVSHGASTDEDTVWSRDL